jgi:ribose 5-phosphate isomerase B
MNIAIGADHRGFLHKEYIKEHISRIGDHVIEWHDVGANNETRSDYPLFAQRVAELMISKKVSYGILICGSGIGMAVVANRYSGIYAGVAWDEKVAYMSRQHDNVNVLVIPSDFVTREMAVRMVVMWLNASFLAGRYQERIDMIDVINKCS